MVGQVQSPLMLFRVEKKQQTPVKRALTKWSIFALLFLHRGTDYTFCTHLPAQKLTPAKIDHK
jgi:hypothetical protein